MDIKPSNVLITMDGQPMLLDFHLASGPILAGECVADRLGGTPGWMSPEQEAAMFAVGEGGPSRRRSIGGPISSPSASCCATRWVSAERTNEVATRGRGSRGTTP
jgi:serine/threonine protein kinase